MLNFILGQKIHANNMIYIGTFPGATFIYLENPITQFHKTYALAEQLRLQAGFRKSTNKNM